MGRTPLILTALLTIGCHVGAGPTLGYAPKHGFVAGWHALGGEGPEGRSGDARTGVGWAVGQSFRSGDAWRGLSYGVLGMKVYDRADGGDDAAGLGAMIGLSMSRGDAAAAAGFSAGLGHSDGTCDGDDYFYELDVAVRWMGGAVEIVVEPTAGLWGGRTCTIPIARPAP